MSTNEDLAEAGENLSAVLQSQGQMIITAESCTGGWIAKALTDKAGSSAYVHGGLVTYSNDMKKALLGVSQQSLDEQGAVSEPVVREMVAGALKATGASIAVAVSGIAGPAGGTREKPVGTVWFAWGRTPDDTKAVRQVFSGDRDAVRRQAVLFALEGVRRFLLD
ncbi:CinA family protein [Marinobacter salicampi]|uniref:CinA family protein n=1 Tax=Marinobacter salicampi TaxID=435907 RepID=UPI00140CE395|nr:nicotinamide-nucleotide amidohydrolase family protein [Marinobacter salicampi]